MLSIWLCIYLGGPEANAGAGAPPPGAGAAPGGGQGGAGPTIEEVD